MTKKSTAIKLFTFFLSILITLTPVNTHQVKAAATVRYVASNGVDTSDCSYAQSPCRSIQYAINHSISGDTVLVAEGIYSYAAGADTCPFLLTRAVVCFVDKRLTIVGGYADGNWYAYNPAQNITTIDGSARYRGVAAIGYNTTTSHLEMWGFTIQNSRAQGPTYTNPYDPSGVGAGMLVQHASVTLKDLIFQNNLAIGQTITGQSGAGGQADGAGLRIEQPPTGTTSLLQRVVFKNNTSIGGNGPDRGGIAFGALFSYKANMIIEDARFENNLAQAGNTNTPGGEGLYGNLRADALGGGIAVMEGTVTLNRIEVVNNQAIGGNSNKYGGGGYGGGIFVEDFGAKATQVSINDSLITGNNATAGNGLIGGNSAGGGLDVDSSSVSIDRTQIILNSAIGGSGETAGPGAGGGLYIFKVRDGNFQALMKNVVVANNFADQGSGSRSAGNGGGGGIVIHGVTTSIMNTTIASNQIGVNMVLGQGLLVQPWPDPTNAQFIPSVQLSSSIIANHVANNLSPAIIIQKNSTLIIDEGIFSGNSKDINNDGVPVPNGTISGLASMDYGQNAGFIAPEGPFYNYHLRQDAFARNKSGKLLTTYDLDLQPRPQENKTDYGADEYHPFNLGYTPNNNVIYIDWSAGVGLFIGGVDHYGVIVDCEAGANSPNQGSCGKEITIDNTNITLTGLTNFKFYTVTVYAYNSMNQLIAISIQIQAFPTDILIYLPSIVR